MPKRFLFLFFLFTLSTIAFSSNGIHFHSLTMKDGLSSNEVNCIFKDSKGFMWFGTDDGLNRYDGLRFDVFRHEATNRNSISGNKIRSIVEDPFGNLWISCEGGLVKFDRETERFQSYRLNLKKRPTEKTIGPLYVDRQGFLWVTFEGETMVLDPKTGKRKGILQNKSIDKFICSKTIIHFFEDAKSNLWLSAWGVGLIKLDADRKKITLFKHDPKNDNTLSDNNILTIYEDKNQRLWMGTFEHGLCIFDPLKNKFSNINSPQLGMLLLKIAADRNNQIWICQGHSVAIIKKQDPNQISIQKNNPSDFNSFTPDYAKTFYVDNSGIIWFGTCNDGVCYHDPNETKFTPFSPYELFELPFQKEFVRAFSFPNAQQLLIGTFNGLLIYHSTNHTVSRLTAASSGFPSDNIADICSLPSGMVWLGTPKGMVLFDPKTQKTIKKLDQSNGLCNNGIQKLYTDSKSNVWVATEKGLDLLQNGRFTHFNQNGLGIFKINDMVEDRNGNVWIATTIGLHKYVRKSGQFTPHLYNANDQKSVSSSEALSLLVDQKGLLWVGTRTGLNFYNAETDTFEPYSKNREIAGRSIYKMVEVARDEFWISSNPELYRLNIATGIAKSYDDRDGLLQNTAALEKGPDGKIYIAGKHAGFYSFHPHQILNNPLPPLS